MRRCFILISLLLAIASALIGWRTWRDLRPTPHSLLLDQAAVRKLRVLDRHGIPLSVTYQNDWNLHDRLPLHEMPAFLQQAFIDAEDRRFYRHHGVDWLARLHALLQNVKALRAVRGASTITEQVVRMLHPRPRTVWSRWLEGFEASQLEGRFAKAEILEFYLNQVPYAHRRRGVAQAASLYFDRDLSTLSMKEMLALAVLVRAPSGMDLRRESERTEKSVAGLAAAMLAAGEISRDQYQRILNGGWSFSRFRLPVEASHFVRRLVSGSFATAEISQDAQRTGRVITTLDAALQSRVQQILDSRLQDIRDKAVTDGAVLVVDHQSDEILAWVDGGGARSDQGGSWIDAVITPRQPGSTLKPFLYALALESGWNAATLIDDSPLAERVGTGLHSFKNYSRSCHGPMRLRDALANSLNIPAIRTIQFTGTERFLELLKAMGVKSLARPASHYGTGLALGNGEVTLFELVQAYAALARAGIFRPLRFLMSPARPPESPYRVLTGESASLIAHILSDPQARRLEFGEGNLLRLPVPTAVKTGTSNDHRDAWTIGFSRRYTVGVWMGNLDRSPTSGVTGTSGPALVLRSVFAELNRYEQPEPLYLSPGLIPVTICRNSGLRATDRCPTLQEWFVPANAPVEHCQLSELEPGHAVRHLAAPKRTEAIALLQPTADLQLVMDPRIPDELEAFSLLISKEINPQKVEWVIDERVAGITGNNEYKFTWPLSRGTHYAMAKVWRHGSEAPVETPQVTFSVK